MFIRSAYSLFSPEGDSAAPAPSTPAPAASSGADGGVGETASSVDDVFDAAVKHYSKWEDPKDRTTNPQEEEEDIFGDKPSDEEQSPEQGDNKPVDGKDKNQKPKEESEFKPYKFKASIDGKEVEREFKTPEELNRALAKAEVAPRLWQEAKKLQSEIERMKPEAEFAADLLATAKEEPMEFLKIMESDLIPTDVLSSWIYDKYHEFARIANLSPQEQAAWAMRKEAEKIVEENRYRRQLEEESRRRQTEQVEAASAKEFNTWVEREKGRWYKDVPKEYHDNILLAMKSVVAYARREIDKGEEVSFKRMTGMLNTILAPYKSSMSPAQREREVAKSVEAKKAQATSTLQRASQNASSSRGDASPGKLAYSIDDIFDGSIAALKSGRVKWRD
jgi:hypothetical protein